MIFKDINDHESCMPYEPKFYIDYFKNLKSVIINYIQEKSES